MTEPTATAPAPKKRSLFKRAAWQDAPKKENDDIFSHSNEFKDIIAEQNRRRAEEKQKEEAEAKQKKASIPRESKSKRRRVSAEDGKPALSKSESASPAGTRRTPRRSNSRTPLPPAPDSLAARYDSLTKSPPSEDSPCRKESMIIDLGDDDDDDKFIQPSHTSWQGDHNRGLAVRPSKRPAMDVNEEIEEVLDPALAALQARARRRALERSESTGTTGPDGARPRAPIVQLFIQPEIPDASPLMIKVRIDSTLEKPRKAWCERQKFSPEMTRGIFFTSRGTRLFDSTTIKRLGLQVDKHGNVSVDGDSTIYDEVNIPKLHVEAWTEELFLKWKRQVAAEAAAKKTAAESPPEAEERAPTLEPEPVASKIRLVLKVKGRDDFRLTVKPETTFEHITSAYKTKNKVSKEQPITLTFDGERLSPMDTVADADIEDMDAIDVLFH